MARNKLSEEEALKRIDSQMSNEERLRSADVQIDNSGDEGQTAAFVKNECTKLATQYNTGK
tara:strand:+ start:678 stop:860 length:183 start_codon:yes stop_codon:yes gene_type:complete